MAAAFPVHLSKAILGGFKEQFKKDGLVLNGAVGIHEWCAGTDDQGRHEYVEADEHNVILKFDSGEGLFFDDLAKQKLSIPLVTQARQKKLETSETKNSWKQVPISEVCRITGRPHRYKFGRLM